MVAILIIISREGGLGPDSGTRGVAFAQRGRGWPEIRSLAITLRPQSWSNGRGERMRDSVAHSEREGGTPSDVRWIPRQRLRGMKILDWAPGFRRGDVNSDWVPAFAGMTSTT